MSNASRTVDQNNLHAHLERLEWPVHLELGIEQVDDQHKRFFDLVASFVAGGDQVRMMRTLALLNEYVMNHFRDEEALMAASRYPRLEAHQQRHLDFRATLGSLLERARSMTLDEIADDVQHLIYEWFCRHIMTDDLDYAKHIATFQASRSGKWRSLPGY